jgi:hypothetical protein
MPPLDFPPVCDFILEDGTACPMPATHFWGHEGHKVFMCCAHFDQFAPTLFRENALVGIAALPESIGEQPAHKPRHIDIVEEYNRQCKRDSIIPGAKCDGDS